MINEEYDGITHLVLNELYDTLLGKLGNAYDKRPANPKDKFEEGREKFIDVLKLEDKVKLLKNTMVLFSSVATTTTDLSLIDAPKVAGNITYSKERHTRDEVELADSSSYWRRQVGLQPQLFNSKTKR